MNNAIFFYPKPQNEPILKYSAGSPEKKQLKEAIRDICSRKEEIPLIIGGKEYRTGDTGTVVMPHDHHHILATYHKAGKKEVALAIEAALAARHQWESTPWAERVSIVLKVAELISKKYRFQLNAATMMGQSKNAFQAEIDAACESADFLRFNAHYASTIYTEQPISDVGIINRTEYRPLEGFVYAVTPFNFTAIAMNLPLSPIIMGNTVVWKPASNSLLSSYYLMQIYKEAGLPDGVLNFIPGKGSVGSEVVLQHPELAGIHFTGSTAVFKNLWQNAGKNLSVYKSYPRLIGETGGKDFMVVHPSANPLEVATSLILGSFEYQGQKCSATSRAYIPSSLWGAISAEIEKMMRDIKVGDPRDFRNFVNAVIDEASFDNCMDYIDKAKTSGEADILFGGSGNKNVGYFIEPTIIVTTNPRFITMQEEIFGPILTLYVYPDDDFKNILETCDQTSPYALTGSIFSRDREALNHACRKLKYAAGNFYINDKTTGATVGQQPFGGARASGTNDKAGSHLNLLRWVSPRTIKENLLPPTSYRYPFMEEE